jgi:hydroxyacylglutathione hydrolase
VTTSISTVPTQSDNYTYLVRRAGQAVAVVVDPGEGASVIRALDALGVTAAAVLCTHHHRDHIEGLGALLERFGELPVYAHEADRGRVPHASHHLSHGQTFRVAELDFSALHVPGHTRGALAYLHEGSVFTGDTLFVAGCGRLFEGSAEQMYGSLNLTLAALPAATAVYCGHEYTQKNLAFALEMEPSNGAVREKAERVSDMRRRGEPSVPSTLGEELSTNPFLRCQSPEIVARLADRLGAADPVSVFAALRAAKDTY